MTVTALAPWMGSNRLLAHHVGEALEGCSWVGIPFAGGMCELKHITARTLCVNDLHREVIHLARVVADPFLGPKLYRRLRRLAFHAETLRDAQAWLSGFCCTGKECFWPLWDYDDETNLLWAECYFVCAWMSRNGLAGTDGEFRSKLATRWDAGGGDSAVRFRSATSALREWRRVLSRATFECLDCFDFLAKCKDAPGHGIYCDPPFPGPGDGYRHKFSEAQHRRLAETLTLYTLTRVVCRFYDHPLVRELYHADEWTCLHLEGRKQTNAAAPEVLLIRGKP